MLISNSFFISSENSWTRWSIVELNTKSSMYTWATRRDFSSHLKKSVWSAGPRLKPWSKRYKVRRSYHDLGACFSPYNAFFNLSTWSGKWGSWNPFGCSKNTSSFKSLFKRHSSHPFGIAWSSWCTLWREEFGLTLALLSEQTTHQSLHFQLEYILEPPI